MTVQTPIHTSVHTLPAYLGDPGVIAYLPHVGCIADVTVVVPRVDRVPVMNKDPIEVVHLRGSGRGSGRAAEGRDVRGAGGEQRVSKSRGAQRG